MANLAAVSYMQMVVNIKAMVFLHVNENITRFTKFLYVVSRELETAMIISHEMPHFMLVTFQELFYDGGMDISKII